MKQHVTSSLSRIFGKFASKQHSKSFQNRINRTYVSMMGLDMSEFNAPESYDTLNALFTRHLKVPRTFSTDANDVISPCDSLVTDAGVMVGNTALQIKGMSYSVDDFLGENIADANKKKLYDGNYINFYLSPRDYHRYHVPLDMQVTKAVHIAGKLYPVNIPTLKRKVNLFIENERVVLECISASGKLFYMVLVGALNVGKMEVSFEPRIQTNTGSGGTYEYENLHLQKGDDLGCFQMGSTIIFLAEHGMLESNLTVGDSVRYSQTIAKLL
jgi:phosphatidylserine decarboxylase